MCLYTIQAFFSITVIAYQEGWLILHCFYLGISLISTYIFVQAVLRCILIFRLIYLRSRNLRRKEKNTFLLGRSALEIRERWRRRRRIRGTNPPFVLYLPPPPPEAHSSQGGVGFIKYASFISSLKLSLKRVLSCCFESKLSGKLNILENIIWNRSFPFPPSFLLVPLSVKAAIINQGGRRRWEGGRFSPPFLLLSLLFIATSFVGKVGNRGGRERLDPT